MYIAFHTFSQFFVSTLIEDPLNAAFKPDRVIFDMCSNVNRSSPSMAANWWSIVSSTQSILLRLMERIQRWYCSFSHNFIILCVGKFLISRNIIQRSDEISARISTTPFMLYSPSRIQLNSTYSNVDSFTILFAKMRKSSCILRLLDIIP